MTLTDALRKAAKYSKLKRAYRFVVAEGGDFDTATEHDLDTFWYGANVVACFDDEGNRVAVD